MGCLMFNFRRRGTVIDEGLRIVGSVVADGLVELRGKFDGELQCTDLIVSRTALLKGAVTAERVQVDGRIEGPVTGRDVILKSGAQVIGDIYHETLTVESGAVFDGASKMTSGSAEVEKLSEVRAVGRSNETSPRSADGT